MTTPNSERESLLPCPFCGSDKHLLMKFEGHEYYNCISCTHCDMDGPYGKDPIKKWNTRAPASAEDARDAAQQND